MNISKIALPLGVGSPVSVRIPTVFQRGSGEFDPIRHSLFLNITQSDVLRPSSILVREESTSTQYVTSAPLRAANTQEATYDLFPWVRAMREVRALYEGGRVLEARKSLEEAHQRLRYENVQEVINFFRVALNLVETYDEKGRDLLGFLSDASHMPMSCRPMVRPGERDSEGAVDLDPLTRQLMAVFSLSDKDIDRMCSWADIRFRIEYGSKVVDRALQGYRGMIGSYPSVYKKDYAEARGLYRQFCEKPENLGKTAEALSREFVDYLSTISDWLKFLFEDELGKELLLATPGMTAEDVLRKVEGWEADVPKVFVEPYIDSKNINLDLEKANVFSITIEKLLVLLPMMSFSEEKGKELSDLLNNILAQIKERSSPFFDEDPVIHQLICASRIYRGLAGYTPKDRFMEAPLSDEAESVKYFEKVIIPKQESNVVPIREEQQDKIEGYLLALIDRATETENKARKLLCWNLLHDYYDAQAQYLIETTENYNESTESPLYKALYEKALRYRKLIMENSEDYPEDWKYSYREEE